MSYPGPIPFEPFGSQDKHDDDGQVLDSFLIETDAPPDLKDATEPIAPNAVKEIPRITRIITGELSIPVAWNNTPTMLLPADPNRIGFGCRILSGAAAAVASDGVRIASDVGDLPRAGKLLHMQDDPGSAFANHTGAIWVTTCGTTTGAPFASDVVLVEYWSVTK